MNVLLERALVLAGRAATGLLPIVVAAVASRRYGLASMGEIATVLAAAYAIGEVADLQSQRYVPRVVHDGGRSLRAAEIAHFTAWRFLVLAAGCIVVGAAFVALGLNHLSLSMALLTSAIWIVASNTFYATALAEGHFAAMGLGPCIALASTVGFALALDRASSAAGAWTLVAAVHLGRLCEFGFLALRERWPGLAFSRAGLRDEWRRTFYLALLALTSAAHARLLLPFTVLLAGATVAGAMAIATSLLSAVSLALVSIAVPAYRHALSGGPAAFLGQAFIRVRRDFWLAMVMAAGLVLVLWWGMPRIVAAVFDVEDAGVVVIARTVALAGLFEGPSLLAGVCYQACFRDRLLFRLSATAALGGFLLIAVGYALGGPRGLAWGFTCSRALGAVILYAPFAAGCSVPVQLRNDASGRPS